jgi:hypothetical protein
MKRLRGIAGVFLIFIFGVIVGAALTSGAIWKELHDFVEGGPDAVVAKISDRLNKELRDAGELVGRRPIQRVGVLGQHRRPRLEQRTLT